MFDNAIIVDSAVSTFNNAALASPAFLWCGLLAIPLFLFVYFCSNAFMVKLGWNRENIIARTALVVSVLTLGWIILSGGNYSVLRDDVSLLPFSVAAIVLLCSFFIATRTRNISASYLRDLSKRQRFGVYAVLLLFFVALGLSDIHAWWGPILQIGACILGIVMGRAVKRNISDVFGTLLVMSMCVIVILMQPEFFRFGQLGGLTILHLLCLLMFAGFVAGTLVINNVQPRGRVHHSAFVKLKWMARFVTALCVVLFVLTESVPVFIGTFAMFIVSFALSQWHMQSVPSMLGNRFFALAVMMFGVITIMPAITALGILVLASLPKSAIWHDSKFLL